MAKKKQGGIEIEVAEGSGEIELTVRGNQVGLALTISALKAKLKAYGVKNLDNRDLTLVLTIPVPPEDDDMVGTQKTKKALSG